MTNFTIGADPEIFAIKNNKGISAHALVKGTKEAPHKVKYGAYQVDGMALEFNVDPTTLSSDAGSTFSTKIQHVLDKLKADARLADPAIQFSNKSVMEFSPEVFSTTPDEAKELGCNPDFNAYTGEMNPAPDASDVNFRTGAGHIHIGWGSDLPVDHPEHIAICQRAVKAMDLFVGLYMTVLDPEPRRRQLYGKAGAFRPKPYGVEYRTPSNAWINTDYNRRAIYELTYSAMYFLRNGRTTASLPNPIEPSKFLTEEFVRNVIDEGDWKKAKTLLNTVLQYGYTTYASAQVETIYQTRLKLEDKHSVKQVAPSIPVEKAPTKVTKKVA